MKTEPGTAIVLHGNQSGNSHTLCSAATGTGSVVDEIHRVARDNDIPLRHDRDLTAALASVDLSSTIPPELFRAVAEVLAFVHQMNAKDV